MIIKKLTITPNKTTLVYLHDYQDPVDKTVVIDGELPDEIQTDADTIADQIIEIATRAYVEDKKQEHFGFDTAPNDDFNKGADPDGE